MRTGAARGYGIALVVTARITIPVAARLSEVVVWAMLEGKLTY